MTDVEKKRIALERAAQLRNEIQDYLDVEKSISTGTSRKEQAEKTKRKILELFDATPEQWDDWKWQISNRITKVKDLEKVIQIAPEEKKNIERVSIKYRWAISPYYVSLMENNNPKCPIRRQSIPSIEELNAGGEADPMGEEYTAPVEYITRRYPDRLIIKVTNQCAMYCRHCQRRRAIGQQDKGTPIESIKGCIEYVRQNPEVRDVLLTGGDALLIPDQEIEWILQELRKIEHVEIIRIGTRTPVTMPQRITNELCEMLSRYHPIYLNTHFNSPAEVTPEAAKAADRLAKVGIPLGNQCVLLRGINDDPHIMKKLNQELLKIRIKPYYIFHPKDVMGTKHFKVKIQEGLEIMEKLRGYTSGLAVPNYIVNAPKGKGKTPLLPNYILGFNKDTVKIRTWEGAIIDYPN